MFNMKCLRRGLGVNVAMPLHFFNVFFDIVLVNEKVIKKVKTIRDERGRGWKIKQVLHAHDNVHGRIERSSEFRRACDRMKLRTNAMRIKY